MTQYEPLTNSNIWRVNSYDEVTIDETGMPVCRVKDVLSALEGLKDELCTGLKCSNCKIVDKWFPFASSQSIVQTKTVGTYENTDKVGGSEIDEHLCVCGHKEKKHTVFLGEAEMCEKAGCSCEGFVEKGFLK